MNLTPKLKAKLKDLPKEPGVYFHKNADGEVIYVGKAAILRNRVRQYFQSPDRKDTKTRALVAEIDDTDWIVVDTEMDALFLEAEMIKRYISEELLMAVREKICSSLGALYKGRYAGPFGVDMMVVRSEANVPFLLNPCVEINLRRTMGHVALALASHYPSDQVMSIKYSDKSYKLQISPNGIYNKGECK